MFVFVCGDFFLLKYNNRNDFCDKNSFVWRHSIGWQSDPWLQLRSLGWSKAPWVKKNRSRKVNKVWSVKRHWKIFWKMERFCSIIIDTGKRLHTVYSLNRLDDGQIINAQKWKAFNGGPERAKMAMNEAKPPKEMEKWPKWLRKPPRQSKNQSKEIASRPKPNDKVDKAEWFGLGLG